MQRYNIPSNSAMKCPKILKKIGLYKMFAIRLLINQSSDLDKLALSLHR